MHDHFTREITYESNFTSRENFQLQRTLSPTILSKSNNNNIIWVSPSFGHLVSRGPCGWVLCCPCFIIGLRWQVPPQVGWPHWQVVW